MKLQFLVALASCVAGLGREHTGTRVFQEGQEKERLPHTFIQFQEEIKIVGMIRELGCAIVVCACVYVCCCLHRCCRLLSVCVLACIYVTAYNNVPVSATLLVVCRPAQRVSANTVTYVIVHLTMSVARCNDRCRFLLIVQQSMLQVCILCAMVSKLMVDLPREHIPPFSWISTLLRLFFEHVCYFTMIHQMRA